MSPLARPSRRALFLAAALILGARAPAAQLAAAPGAGDVVAVVVNGHPILEREVDERLLALVAEQTGGAMLPDAELGELRAALHDDIVDLLVDDVLLDEAADADGIAFSDADVLAEIEREVEGFCVKTGTTRAEFAERVLESDGITLEEFLADRAADPDYRRGMRHARLVDSRYPERTAVTAEEVAERYELDLPDVYDRPALVRARHILVACEEDASDDEVTAAHERAEMLLDRARTQDVAFADLARDHSDDGSSVDGGDLGWFPRDGIPFEAFGAAAFALEPGQLSEPVRTPFGFHVIECVARKPAEVVPLEVAASSIRLELHWEKLDAARAELLADLRDAARITRG